MSTFVYSPGMQVYIDSYKRGAIIDVSDDVVNAGMQRRADGVSQFQFSLMNARRKYDNVFIPNDRLVVVMKRLTWMRTFTGYLNQAPLFSSWPRDVNLTASCSLKRLQYFFWDPGMAASQTLVAESLTSARRNLDGTAPDGGIKQAVINLLEEVVDWSGAQAAHDKSLAGSKIHIGGIPARWFDFAAKIAQSVKDNVEQEAALARTLLASLGANATLAGANLGGQSSVPAGTAGLNAKQAAWATQVIGVVFANGFTQKDAEVAIGCCLQESGLQMYANSRLPESLKIAHDRVGNDHLSVGLFQQQAGPGFDWGTVAECMDVQHSTEKFLSVLKTISNRDSLPFTVVIQRVQASAYPNAYAKHEKPAKEIVAAYVAGLATATLGNDPRGNVVASNNANTGQGGNASLDVGHGTTTDTHIIEVAQQVCQQNVRYSEPLASNYDVASPRYLDCSAFTRWVYFHAVGNLNGMPRTAADQYDWAIKNGAKNLRVQDAVNMPGVLLFKGKPAPDGIGHVEFSMGGGRHIGAHKTGVVAGSGGAPASYWDYACTLPNVVYGNNTPAIADLNGTNATGAALSAQVQHALDSTGATADMTDVVPGASALDSLFGSIPWDNVVQTDNETSNSLFGIRAMLNDTPILDYIKNLVNATMRQFCSAPNGDFIAWFPDYYGIWGTAAKMVLQSIEVKDFTVDWSDEYLVTHQFVAASYDPGSIQLNAETGDTSALALTNLTETTGIATIDQPSIMAALFGLDQTPDETDRFTKFIYERFGPRPNFTQVPTVTGPKGEFFMALFLFMQNWTAQYNANIDITFMPELWPGMIIQFPEYNFQAYVTAVTHNVQYGPSGGFSTTINICAPARIKDTGGEDKLIGLPIAAGLMSSGRSSDPTTKKAATKQIPPKTKAEADRHSKALSAKLERIPE